jgi:hypothetical protein
MKMKDLIHIINKQDYLITLLLSLLLHSCSSDIKALEFHQGKIELTYYCDKQTQCDWCSKPKVFRNYTKVSYEKGYFELLGEDKNCFFPISKKMFLLKKVGAKIYIQFYQKDELKKIPFYSLVKKDTVLQPSFSNINDKKLTFDSKSLFDSECQISFRNQLIKCYKFKVFSGRCLSKRLNCSVRTNIFLEKESLVPIRIETKYFNPIYDKEIKNTFDNIVLSDWKFIHN